MGYILLFLVILLCFLPPPYSGNLDSYKLIQALRQGAENETRASKRRNHHSVLRRMWPIR